MEKLNDYLMPDYFTSFRCKMGACRSACCEGWPISVSMKDYFMLLGADVSKELRIRLDCALHLAEHPTEDAYAVILPRYDGNCAVRMADGRCAIHCELGEDALSSVCRLYPRGVRTGETHECSCANSCEAIVEMFFDREEKIRFVSAPMDFHVPERKKRVHTFETAGYEQEIRLMLISIMQERDFLIPERMVLLGRRMHLIDEAMKNKNHERIVELIHESGKEEAPLLKQPTHGDVLDGLEISNHMLSLLDERSESIRAYGENALALFGEGESEYEIYMRAKEAFQTSCPEWEKWFEHMIVNHMFFSQFPYQDRPMDLEDEFLALCAVYMLLRFLLIGNMKDGFKKDEAADVCAAVFRLVDHTDFERYAGKLLKRLCGGDGMKAMRVLCL